MNLNENEILIGQKLYTINEIRVNQIISLMDAFKSGEKGVFDVLHLILKLVCNVTLEDLKTMTFKEIHSIIEAVKNTNNGFFLIAESLAVEDLAKKILSQIMDEVKADFLQSLKEDKKA